MLKKITRTIYFLIPFKKQVLSVVKKNYLPRFYRSLQFKGSFSVSLGNTQKFKMYHDYHYGLETELFWRGIEDGWETVSLSLWRLLCEDAEIIMDVGAHEGLYSLTSSAISSSKVYAFEPLPSAFNSLAKNVELNLFPVECLQLALSNYDGDGEFFTNGDDHSTESSLKKESVPNTHLKEIAVTVKRLDSYIDSIHLEKVDLIKIDVEGSEPEVLEGMGRYLREFKPSILIEILSDEIASSVEEIIVDLDYIFFDINDDTQNGKKGYKRTYNLKKSTCLNYLLIQPEKASRLNLVANSLSSF